MENNLELLEELRQKAAELLEAKDQGTEIVEKTLTEADLDAMSDEEFADLIENADQLDEISTNTLNRYRETARYDRHLLNRDIRKDGGGAMLGKDDPWVKQRDNRTAGIKKATKKLNARGVSEESSEESSDISSIFAGEDLSEEFKTKATAIFEAAVAQRVKAIEESYATALGEYKAEHDQKSLTESEELVEGLTEKVDGYLDYVVEQWITDNEIALERGIKADLFESFMGGMKSLFEEHHINVPEQELEVLDELRSVNEGLESKMDEMLEENVALRKELKDIARHVSIAEAAEGLSELDTERFVELAEGLSYDTEDGFKNKLAAIRENFFQKTAENQKQLSESVVTDEPVIIEEETRAPQFDPSINAYVSALTRNKI